MGISPSGAFHRLGHWMLGWVGVTAGLALAGRENPAPASLLNNLVRQLTEKRAAQAAVKTPGKPPPHCRRDEGGDVHEEEAELEEEIDNDKEKHPTRH